MKPQYYIEINGKPKGPFTIEELGNLSITSESAVWKEGFSTWLKASEVEELKSIIRLPTIPKKIIPPPLTHSNDNTVNLLKVSHIEIINTIFRLNRKLIFRIGLLTIALYVLLGLVKGGFKAMELDLKYSQYVKSAKGVKEIERLKDIASTNKAIEISKHDTTTVGVLPISLFVRNMYKDEKPIPTPYKDLTEYYHYIDNPDPSDPYLDFHMINALEEKINYSFGLTTILEVLGFFVASMLVIVLNSKLWKN